MNSEPLDLVYVVGPGEDNEQLRYSLRSTANLPHRKVWIIGYKPTWVRGVEHVYIDQGHPTASKYDKVAANLRVACGEPGVSRHFVLMNDDFFITRPIDSVPVLHRGQIDEVIAEYEARRQEPSNYVRGMAITRDLLRHLGQPTLSYALHTPMIVNKHILASVIGYLSKNRQHYGTAASHLRTLYGNMAGIGGQQAQDCKVIHTTEEALAQALDSGVPFLSTHERSFEAGAVGKYLRRLYSTPGRYE